jgi:FKBP-type peptidyl-prolyl cis-trans isomerase
MKFSRIIFVPLLTMSMALPAMAEERSADEQTIYFLGTAMGRNLDVLALSEGEKKAVVQGLEDSLAGTVEPMNEAEYSQRINTLTQGRVAAAAAREAEAGKAYLAQMAEEDGAVTTESGLIYREIKAGEGKQPEATSPIIAHYEGKLRDGTVFDSSYSRGDPLTIALNQVIPCWTEAIVKMKEGGKSKITCPSSIAYGERGSGSIPPNAVLTFDVELIQVLDQP